MVNNENNIAAFIINLITLVHGLFASFISTIIFVIIIYHQYNNRMKQVHKITFILCANIYLMILMYSAALVSFNIHTLLGDLYGQDFDSSWCTFRGYFVAAMICALYNGFVVQAFFRLCRIVYSSCQQLQLLWFYVILIPIQLIISFTFLSPLLIWHDVVYLPNEHYCFVSFKNVRGIVWTGVTNYGIPLFCLSILYLRITIFVRRQPNTQTIARKRRQKRDFLVIQRIILIVSILFALGIPSIILISMLFVTGIEHPLSYRITWLSTNVSMAVLSVITVFMTPQLKSLIMRRWQRNRVMPMRITIANSVEVRSVHTVR